MTIIETPLEATEIPAGFADKLQGAVRGEVAFDDYSRHLFSRDASMYTIYPLGVVYPLDAGDVAAAVRVAAQFGVQITPPWRFDQPGRADRGCRNNSRLLPPHEPHSGY
jgi:hypothetical protein